MLSAVKRYKSLLSGVLLRYFPRTTAYLRAERETALFHPMPARRAKKASVSVSKTRKTKTASAKKPAKPHTKCNS
jgi:hypothetical protein